MKAASLLNFSSDRLINLKQKAVKPRIGKESVAHWYCLS
jgi:hypothetical protein